MDTPLTRRPDGFLDRGAGVTRVEAFVDAAFAFAVTLLVISLDAMPSSIGAMLDALKGVPAFLASFLQIMMFWSAHATWSRRFGLDDAASQRRSLLLVFLVLVYVYPLKILFGSLFAWLSGGWFPPVAQIRTMDDLRMMFVMYGIAFGSLSLALASLHAHALRTAVVPALGDDERRLTRGEVRRWCFTAMVAGLSMLAALALPAGSPTWLLGMPGMLYALLSFTGRVVNPPAR
jgi:uncharacterized membrane protein